MTDKLFEDACMKYGDRVVMEVLNFGMKGIWKKPFLLELIASEGLDRCKEVIGMTKKKDGGEVVGKPIDWDNIESVKNYLTFNIDEEKTIKLLDEGVLLDSFFKEGQKTFRFRVLCSGREVDWYVPNTIMLYLRKVRIGRQNLAGVVIKVHRTTQYNYMVERIE